MWFTSVYVRPTGRKIKIDAGDETTFSNLCGWNKDWEKFCFGYQNNEVEGVTDYGDGAAVDISQQADYMA